MPSNTVLRSSLLSSVFRLMLGSGSVRTARMCIVDIISIPISTKAPTYGVELSPVPLSLKLFTVPSVLFLVVAFESHGANITNCWDGGT